METRKITSIKAKLKDQTNKNKQIWSIYQFNIKNYLDLNKIILYKFIQKYVKFRMPNLDILTFKT